MKIVVEVAGLDVGGLFTPKQKEVVSSDGRAIAFRQEPAVEASPKAKKSEATESRESWYCLFFVAGTLFFLVFQPLNAPAKKLFHPSAIIKVEQSLPPVATGKHIRPTTGVITSRFGKRKSPTAGASSFHQGLDFGANTGTPIVASQSGTVTFSGDKGGLGRTVVIDHGNGVQTVYGHCSELKVKAGDKVDQKQVIALVGSTGVSTGPHLHWEFIVNGQKVDPEGRL